MRFAVSIFFVLIILCNSASSAFAWGSRGHHIVAEIAFRFLASADKEKIMSYLNDMTIEDASTWLDEIRSDPKYVYTAPWHYVDYPEEQNTSLPRSPISLTPSIVL